MTVVKRIASTIPLSVVLQPEVRCAPARNKCGPAALE